MSSDASTRKAELQAYLATCGQGHILDGYDSLSDAEQLNLWNFVFQRGTDLRHLNKVLQASLALLHGSSGSGGDGAARPAVMEPPPLASIFEVERERRMRKKSTSAHPSGPTRLQKMEQLGYDYIARGRTAVLLLAGGSGTRLGVNYPKGLFTYEHERAPGSGAAAPLLCESTKSLFQFHCEKLKKVEELAHAHAASAASSSASSGDRHPSGKIQLLVMTSEQNDAQTQQYFADHGFFGLAPAQVHFFTQTSLPVYDAAPDASGAVDADGCPVHRVLMAAPGQPCVAPGGNGGVYQSLVREPHTCTTEPDKQPAQQRRAGKRAGGVLGKLQRQGVRYVQIFSVDNLLAKIADPLFYGYTATHRCHVTVKTTPKASAAERVGVFVRVDGRWGVVEYTELGEERAAQRTATTAPPQTTSAQEGELLYNCGNIAIHCCSVAFLQFAAAMMRSETHFHAALKKVAVHGGAEEAKAVKLEAFIFDMFHYCSDPAVDRVAGTSGASGKARGEAPRKRAKGKTRMVRGDRFGILQVDRAKEFAPIKNSTETSSTDNAFTAAELLLSLHTDWAIVHLRKELRRAAAGGPRSAAADKQRALLKEALTRLKANRHWLRVELSPAVTYAGEGLAPYNDWLVSSILQATAQPHVDTDGPAILFLEPHITAAHSKI